MANKNNLLNLLKSTDKFVVPKIQRDYAQGRDKGSNKELCEEVRTGLIQSLLNTLVKGDSLLLDYIYGTNDFKVFYPIDGQQRLTTLFLLHWYIGKKEGINGITDSEGNSEFDLLRKFSYEIRDTSEEFCEALIDIDVGFEQASISDQIKDSPSYHDAYGFDPTVSSMLIVLDEIHHQYKDINPENLPLWDNLKRIEFWCLSLEHFGLTDDLFVKMNARGKRLSRFDVFKSDLESMLEKNEYENIEIWKAEIDNTYLDAFWNKFGFELSERNLFRTILFFVKELIAANNAGAEYNDAWEVDDLNVYYYDVIEQIKAFPDTLTRICHLLSNFNEWKDSVDESELFVTPGVIEQHNILGYNKLKVFGILYWFSFDFNMTADNNYYKFKRILENYVFSLRQYNIKPRNYSSSIDNKNIANYIGFVKQLIDGYSDRANDFYTYVRSSSYPALELERQKLEYVSFNDILDIESVRYLKGNIHNFFFDGYLHLNKSEIEQLFSDENLINKALRIIYSYVDDSYGSFQKLLADEITQQSGKKQLYYKDENDKATAYFHKFFFNPDAEFGDMLLTAKGERQYAEISRCVKLFTVGVRDKLNNGESLPYAIDSLLRDRISEQSFADSQNIKWYIVKYSEFFHDVTGTSLSVLRRKNYGGDDEDNIYDIQCLNIADNGFYQDHYHPFYLALCRRLNNQVTIDESSLKYTGVQIEYAHPCVLSNGWIIKINNEGNWIIDFAGNLPSVQINDLQINADGFGEIICTGLDSIEKMANVLNALPLQS